MRSVLKTKNEVSGHDRNHDNDQVATQDEWGPTIKHHNAPFDAGDLTFLSVTLALICVGLNLYGKQFWGYILANYSKPVIISVGTLVVVHGHFWIWVPLLAVLDLYQFPKSFWRYKIQPKKIPTWEWYTKALRLVLGNQVLVSVVASPFLYMAVEWRGHPTGMEIPTSWQIVKELVAMIMIWEISFYYIHRLLHRPWFYRRFHKQHHQFTAPIGIAAIYCHPVEYIILQMSSVLLGPVVMNSHILLVWVWIVLAQTIAINVHCGFHLPFLPSPLAHDYHHEVFNKNYGAIGLLDWLHGTAGIRKVALEKKKKDPALVTFSLPPKNIAV